MDERSRWPHRRADRRDDELRDIELEPLLDEQRGRAVGHRASRMVMPVLPLTADGAEQRTGPHHRTVMHGVIERRITAVQHRTGELLGEMGQMRGHGAPRTIGGPWVHGAAASRA